MPEGSTDFANILFAGPCNRRCYYCIGLRLPAHVNASNLDVFPPRNLEGFLAAVEARGIRQLVFTGTVSDPQLYQHQGALLKLLRQRLPQAQISLHTNGALTLRQLQVWNQYDRACLSLPSFDPEIYARHTGSRAVPELAEILKASKIPVKVSCVLDEHNAPQLPGFLARCARLGVRRLVLRRQFGDPRRWDLLRGLPRRGTYRGNPVHDFEGMEVTYWSFDDASSTSINLFADGTLGTSYLLTDTAQLRRASVAAAGDPGDDVDRREPADRALGR